MKRLLLLFCLTSIGALLSPVVHASMLDNIACAINPISCPAALATAAIDATKDSNTQQYIQSGSGGSASNGVLAKQLSEDLLCGTFKIVSGNLGLFLGFLIATWGLYLWVGKDNMRTGLIYIICGALLTALPGIVFSSMRGLNVVLQTSGITDQTVLRTPTCTRVGGGF